MFTCEVRSSISSMASVSLLICWFQWLGLLKFYFRKVCFLNVNLHQVELLYLKLFPICARFLFLLSIEQFDGVDDFTLSHVMLWVLIKHVRKEKIFELSKKFSYFTHQKSPPVFCSELRQDTVWEGFDFEVRRLFHLEIHLIMS